MAVLKDLIVHGRSRFVNGAQFNTINAESIGASEGIFNKLIATTLDAKAATIDDLTATNATIVGLLDVQGQMQTNSWTNANIATIDGSFYICPTISSEATITTSGTTQTSNNKFLYNGSTIVLTGSWATTGSLYLNTTAANWNLYSKVMITGEVLIGNEWTPIGTIRGVLQGINTSGGTITIGSLSSNITVGSDGTINSLPAILSLVTSGTTYNARKLKVSLYEYNSAGTSSGETNLIGIMMTTAGTHNLTYIDIYNGLNSKTSYTSTIDNTTKATEPMVRIGNLNGLPNIVDGSTSADTKPTGWGIYTTNGFFKGKIVSNAGKIANWDITTSSIQTGAFNTSGTMYFGSSGISLGTTFRVTNAGVLTATSGTIGGYSLTANYLQATDGTTGISVADNSTTASWAFWAGGTTTSTAKFRVDHNGVLYATGAQISGSVEATSGFVVKTSTGTAIATMDGSGIKLGSSGVDTNYNIFIDGSGIKLRYNTNVLNLIDTYGMKIYLPSDTTNAIASFGATSTIGKTTSAHSTIDGNGMRIYGGSNGSTQIAHLGYGEGASLDGTSIAPYFILGTKAEDTSVGNYSAIIGYGCKASGYASFAGGAYSEATTNWSYAYGYVCKAGNNEGDSIAAHAEGNMTKAFGNGAHAEGCDTLAKGQASHASGNGTIANAGQTAIGSYNIEDSDYNYLFIIGNGGYEQYRSNAFMVDQSGDIYPQATKMDDFVIEVKYSDIWTYRKWNSGISECWGRYTWNITTWTAWGSWYYSNASSAVNYPTNLFIEAPSLTTNGRINGLDCALYCRSGTDAATNTATFAFFRPSVGTTGTGQLSLYAIGRWK